MRAVCEARFDGNFGHRTIGVLDEPVCVAHAQLSIQRGRSHTNMLAAHALQLSYGDAELVGDRGDCNRSREILLHEKEGTSHPGLADGLRQRRVWLSITAGALTIKQQYLAGFLSDRPAQVLLNQESGERCGTG